MKVAIVGGGKMGEALFVGFKQKFSDVVVMEPDPVRKEQLAARYGSNVDGSPSAVEEADVVVLAVKPAVLADAVAALTISPSTVVISIAAGITTEAIATLVPAGTDVVRVMPNTPAMVGAGMSVLSPGVGCSDASIQAATDLLATVGEVAIVPESQQDAVTAVSGSGPAYIFLVVEAMTAAGIELGLDPDVAEKLAVQTAFGAASMLRQTDDDAATLRENVTSPAGTTAAALDELERRGLREAFVVAMTAARDRSVELGRGSSN